MAEGANSSDAVPSEGTPARRISGRRMQALLRSAAFGDIVSVMMRAPRHKGLALAALQVNVLPAVQHNQYLIARVRQQGSDLPVAAGFALWASVSDEVDRRLRASKPPLRLTHDEWKSGSNLWLADLVAPSTLAGSMLRDLEQKIAQGREITAHAIANDGTAPLTTVRALLAGVAATPMSLTEIGR